jgi:hypothetical protein
MKKIINTLIFLFFFLLVILAVTLTTIGIETSRFNTLILKKINQTNNNINLELKKIKFKFDIKEVSLFLETIDPLIYYRDTVVPAKNIRVYVDFVSIVKAEPKIKKVNLVLNQLDIKQLKKISITFKPSNFNSFLNNKIKQGKLNAELEIYLNDNNLLDNFIAKGSFSNLKAEVTSDVDLEKTNFNFFADKTDILLKNFSGEIGPVKIINGNFKIKLSSEILLESSFTTNFKFNKNLKDYKNILSNYEYAKDITDLEAEINNNFKINFDETYKVKNYDYTSTGKILKANFDFKKPFENSFLEDKINNLSLIETEIKTNLNIKKKNVIISGKYSFNKGDILSYNLENYIEKKLLKLNLNAEYNKNIEIEAINYKKLKNSIANISINLDKQKDNIRINKLNLIEGNNSIFINDIKIDKNKLLSFKKITVKTNKNGKKNNDFSILYGKKVVINGSQFDASNLPKILSRKTPNNVFSNITKDIEIDLTNVLAPLSENLKNFKLIGKIEKGKFIKISSKGDFGENNYLDITMKKDPNNQKKYLEIYSDLTRPLLTEYSFFKGLTGGKLLYSAIIDGNNYKSKLKIEDFNVINAPGVIKLLSLADLSGLADIAKGEGLSFDVLDIDMEKNKDLLKLNEILALGPSISVIMEGYQNSTVTSLRGNLIPAKTLNTMISKIPVLGNIIIPNEVGEGLFGISFKMKGPPGKIKTTINPIKTITPRFIQKIIEKKRGIK